jgi:hypothetical protein
VTEIKSVGANLIDLPDRTTTEANYVFLNYPVNVAAGKYTFSCKHNTPQGIGWWVKFQNANEEVVGEAETLDYFTNSVTLEIIETAKSITIYVNAPVTMSDIMLNKGTEALPYEPYTANTFAIPAAVQALDEYGKGLSSSYQNAVDFENRKYIQWVRRLTQSEKVLRETDFQYENITYYQITKSGTADYDKTTTNILVSNFEIYKGSESWDSPNRIGTVTGAATYGWYWFGFPAGTTLEQAQEIVNQADILVTTLGYETDLSDILSADNFIEVEGGGTITAVNENGVAVPSQIEYQVEV